MKKKLALAYLVVIRVKIMRLHENDRQSAAFHAPRVIGVSQSTIADSKRAVT
jgi:hypothetical protein